MSDKIGPDGLTDEVIALCAWVVRESWADEHEEDGDSIRALAVRAREKWDAERLAHAAEKAAHAQTQAERDRLRAKMDDVLRYGHSEQCGTSFMRPCTYTFRIAHDALGEVKP